MSTTPHLEDHSPEAVEMLEHMASFRRESTGVDKPATLPASGSRSIRLTLSM
jgi:hypothetical protein